AISADGSLAATVSEDFSCRVWDLDSEEGLHVLEGHSGWVMSVSFIGTKTDIVTASHDGTARVWDGHLGRCLHVLSGHSGEG
ncbi:WD_REPEATS_REGION domain-containing protein, partial [Haematococcus lacustris]